MPTIVTLTANPALDKSAEADHVMPEHKLRCRNLQQEPGGGGINVARAIKKLGGEAVAYFFSGGASGQVLQGLLDAEAVTHQPVPISNPVRESLTIYETSTTLQYRFNMPGPTVTATEWEACLSTMGQLQPRPDYLVASGSLPPGMPGDFYARLAQMAKREGIRMVLDTSTSEALHLALEEGVFLIKPNLREFRFLADSDLEREADQEAFAREMVAKQQSQVVVVSLGAAGVLLISKDGCERLRAPTVPIKSKVGAGDSTVAGIVLALARNRSLREAVQFGVAAGAAAVMTPGSELCRLEDTEKLHQTIRDEHSQNV